jgi:hypothetical protein
MFFKVLMTLSWLGVSTIGDRIRLTSKVRSELQAVQVEAPINNEHELPSTSLSLARNLGLLQQRNVLLGGKKKSKRSSATFSIPRESVDHPKRPKHKTARTWTVTVVCKKKVKKTLKRFQPHWKKIPFSKRA